MNEGNATPSACFHTVSTNVPRSLWSVTLHFVLIAKIRKMGGRSLIMPCLTRLMMLGRIWTTLAGAVVCGSTLLRCGVCDPCCARSECERHSHRTIPVEEDAGIKLVLFLHVTAQRDMARPLAWVVADMQDWTAKATPTWQAGRAVAHKLRASSPAFPWRQNFDNTGAVVCDSRRAATSALARVLL